LFDCFSPVQSEKKALRTISRKAGCALLAVCALQLAVTPLALMRSRLPSMSDELWFGLMILLSSLSVLGGALVGRKLLRNERQDAKGGGRQECRPYSWDTVLLVPAGAALCMLGNIAAVLVEQLAGRAGVEFQGGPEQIVPQSSPGLMVAMLTTGLVPAVVEELLLRGTILPPLRRFGDGFAVVCTAALFALLHQNMEQAPMAFVSGLALGWVYIRGGRLVIPILVHLWNNAAAVALLLLPNRVAYVYVYGLLLLGALSLFILYLRRPQPKRLARGLSPGRRAANFFFGSAAMALALGYFVAVIALNTRMG